MKNKFEKIEPQAEAPSDFDRQYDNPEVLKFGRDKLEIYDVNPEEAKETPVIFAPGWLPNPQVNKDIVKAQFDEGRRTLSLLCAAWDRTGVNKR